MALVNYDDASSTHSFLDSALEPARLHGVQAAAVIAFVTAALGLITAFGISIPPAAPAAIIAFVGAGMALLNGLKRTRDVVIPEAKLVQQTDNGVQPGDEAIDATLPQGPGSTLEEVL